MSGDAYANNVKTDNELRDQAMQRASLRRVYKHDPEEHDDDAGRGVWLSILLLVILLSLAIGLGWWMRGLGVEPARGRGGAYGTLVVPINVAALPRVYITDNDPRHATEGPFTSESAAQAECDRRNAVGVGNRWRTIGTRTVVGGPRG